MGPSLVAKGDSCAGTIRLPVRCGEACRAEDTRRLTAEISLRVVAMFLVVMVLVVVFADVLVIW